MSVTLTSTGGLFTRLGLYLGALNENSSFRYGTTNTRVSNLLAQFASNDQAVVDGLVSARDAYRGAHSGWLQTLKSEAEQTLIQQVNRDTTLSSLTVDAALAEIIRQMASSGDSISQPTVSVTVTAGSSNYGTTKFSATLKDVDGLTSYMVLPETLTATVTSDAGRGATAYREPITVVGTPAVDGLAYNWPGGSGSTTTISVTDATVDGLISNGDFETWSSAVAAPSSWTIATGTAGTTVVRSSTTLRGTYACAIVGNGSELTSINQPLTVANLKPNTVYGVNLWLKRTSGLAAGVLRVRLVDGTNTTITDDASGSNTTSITLSSGTTTSYAAYPVWFVTPKVLPSTVKLVIELTTAATNGESLYVDLVSMVAGTQLYAGGPFVAAWSGGTQAAYKDTFSVAVANNMSTTKFVTLDRIFNLRQLGRKFPTSGSNTINDNLIV